MAAFQEVVAEDQVFWESAVQNALEGVDFVDALADERTFAEQVLVDIRYGARIGINAGLAAEQPNESRAPRAQHAQSDSGLEDGVSFADHALLFVEARLIQGMSHGPDQLPGCVPGELSVSVERDDVFHFTQRTRVADDEREPVGSSPAEQRVQIGEFSPLPFVAQPNSFPSVPTTRPMKQEEYVAALVLVLFVERFDSVPGLVQERLIVELRLGLCVAPVGQQREVEMPIAVCQVTDLERLDEIVHALRTDEHRGSGHQGAIRFGNPVGEIHAGQRPGGNEQRDEPVDDRHAELRSAQQDEQRHRPQEPERRAVAPSLEERGGADGDGDGGNRPEIQGQRMPQGQSP